MGERVTVELDVEALAAAREAGVDLSELLSRALRRHLPSLHAADREQAARQWYRENKEAVDAYNAMIERQGLFSDGVRCFNCLNNSTLLRISIAPKVANIPF